MCDCSCDYDPPSFFRCVTRKAKKEYKCYECGRGIQPGEEYNVSSGKWDGGLDTFRWCMHCTLSQQIHASLTKCHCYLYGDIWSNIQESAASHCAGKQTMALYRLVVGSRRKWRVKRGPRAGELVALPTVALAV